MWFNTRGKVKSATDVIGVLRDENESLRRMLSEAAREIQCAGPVAHRIRILKKEHAAQITAMEEKIERLEGGLNMSERFGFNRGVFRSMSDGPYMLVVDHKAELAAARERGRREMREEVLKEAKDTWEYLWREGGQLATTEESFNEILKVISSLPDKKEDTP